MRRFDYRGFARRLRETRIALGLSEEQAAYQAGRSVVTWRKYEAEGRGNITRALLSLAQHHKGIINWDWMYGGGAGKPLLADPASPPPPSRAALRNAERVW
jgi:transcriptional regulator with XRE-family HTH domain